MPRTGRPRSFDKGEAIAKAMGLFWERGYDSTSLSDLKTAMGDISAASFYAAFGSKEALFREVLARYLDTHGQVIAPLRDPARDPRDAIEQTLRASARMQTDPSHPFGCLLVLSTATCAASSRHIQASLADERQRNRAAFLACVSRAIASAQLPPGTDAQAIATMFDTFLIGLSVQARDGVPLAALQRGISELMRTWDTLAVPASPPSRARPRPRSARTTGASHRGRTSH